MSDTAPPMYTCRDDCRCLLCKIDLSVAHHDATGRVYVEPATPTQAGIAVGAFTQPHLDRQRKRRRA